MAAYTFFGHRDCPDWIKPILCETLEKLIVNHCVSMFYVGNQGRFDALVRSVLRALRDKYPHINYAVVLAYVPGKSHGHQDNGDTMLPEGIESVHPRYAISWRNDWMLRQSDFVVAYIAHAWGGAARYAQKAARLHKVVCNLPVQDLQD